ncbi:MAG TPA: precorrin-6A reductase [Chitinophaga sp.]|uniref:precorrin-6A reductase n=1 Tax=Chitinophaga sp. TaxID=1869181 RepID=UPI002CB7316D|nr:precorrin-6A reductase [Chitinophaga sp.]HVI45283.1 precorrin-6A reductase [Chitinophaga sp.]
MVLVFGGTTEGKLVLSALAEKMLPCWYSSKIKIEVELPANARYRYGAFTPQSLEAFCRQEEIRAIVHASHPFAVVLHETVREVSERLGIPVIRYERQYPALPEHPLIRYADSYETLLPELIAQGFEPVLSLTGVQTIEKWKPFWQHRKMYCRILPRDTSLVVAAAAGFPEQNLLLSFPGKTVEEEIDVIRQTGAQAIVTKESGESGFLSVKADAAITSGVPLYIIRRPALPPHFIRTDNKNGLLAHLDKLLS